MSHKTKVLVFPAGEINAVELHQALSTNVNIELYGASSIERHGQYIFKRYVSGLPLITEDCFLDTFNQLLERYEINLIFPTHDTVTLFFAEHRDALKAKVVSADLRTCQICRDKQATYELFAEEDFCPAVYKTLNKFPAFIKPRQGQGAVGARIINSPQDIGTDDLSPYVVTEYLPGRELTVDCLTDREGILKAVLPRTRERVMAGVSVAGTAIAASNEIMGIARTINKKLGFLGLWYFQVKADNSGRYKLMEISARCAGSMCLSRARGVNLPLLSVYAALGKDIEVFENSYSVRMDRTLVSRYKIDYEYDTVYLDYDDTLVADGKVCLPVIQFVYQCRNENKKVILISRHETDHENTLLDDLEDRGISPNLFFQIICLTCEQEKADYMENRKAAIFIDNAYRERKQVHEKLGIPVLDVEGVEVLLR